MAKATINETDKTITDFLGGRKNLLREISSRTAFFFRVKRRMEISIFFSLLLSSSSVDSSTSLLKLNLPHLSHVTTSTLLGQCLKTFFTSRANRKSPKFKSRATVTAADFCHEGYLIEVEGFSRVLANCVQKICKMGYRFTETRGVLLLFFCPVVVY